jgi:predicted aspartyl protease
MPMLEISLGYSGVAPLIGPIPAVVDTGADGTLIPANILSKFEMAESDRTWIRSQWGEHRSVLTYVVDLHIGSLRLPAVQIVADDRGKEVILGRDVLNKLRVLLDGPAQMTELLEPKAKRK